MERYEQQLPKVTKFTDETSSSPPSTTPIPSNTLLSKLSKKELFMQLSFMLTLTYAVGYPAMYDTISSFIFIAITIDSLYSALGFFRLHIFSGDLTQSQTLSKIKSLYTISLMDRYIYYSFLALIHKSTSLLFHWSRINPIIFYVCMILCSPEIIDKLSSSVLKNILAKLNRKKFKITKIIVARQLAHILNIMFYETVEMKPNLEYTELMPLLEDMETTLKLFYKFFSNFMVAIIVHYIKNKNNRFYLSMLQFSYFYKTGNAISAPNERKAKEEFVNTIILRKWSNLLKPDTFHIIFYIYKNDKSNKFIDDIITTVQYAFMQICALWTLANIFSIPIIIPVISLLLLVYKYVTDKKLLLKLHIIWETTRTPSINNTDKTEIVSKKIQDLEEINQKRLNATSLQLKTNDFFMASKYQIVFPLIASLMAWNKTGLIGICLMSECFYYIICNKVIYSLCIYLYGKLRKFIKRASHYNIYNRFIIAIMFYVKIFNLLVSDPEYNLYSTKQRDILVNVMMIYNIFFQLSNDLDQVKLFITGFMGIFGLLSGYNNLHLLYLAVYIYFFFNLVDYFYPESLKNFSISKTISDISQYQYETIKEKLQKSHNMRIFDSYYRIQSDP